MRQVDTFREPEEEGVETRLDPGSAEGVGELEGRTKVQGRVAVAPVSDLRNPGRQDPRCEDIGDQGRLVRPTGVEALSALHRWAWAGVQFLHSHVLSPRLHRYLRDRARGNLVPVLYNGSPWGSTALGGAPVAQVAAGTEGRENSHDQLGGRTTSPIEQSHGLLPGEAEDLGQPERRRTEE